MNWVDLVQGRDKLMDCCEYGNEPCVCIKWPNMLEYYLILSA